MLDNFLLKIACAIKWMRFPRYVKYAFYLLVKGRHIKVRSKLVVSENLINLNIGNFIDYWIFMDGIYEGNLIKSIVGSSEKGGVFLDIGAHIGVYSISLAGDFGCVYAFEPERKNFNELVRNIELNSINNVKVINKAVSDSKGYAKLYINQEENCGHSLMVNYSGNYQKVRMVTLDDFLKRKTVKVRLIKIDVEGAEIKVLRGGIRTIKKFHPMIIMELNRPVTESYGGNILDIWKILTSLEYNCFILKNNRMIKLRQSDIKDIFYENVIFLYRK